jgi:hypothetical protein
MISPDSLDTNVPLSKTLAEVEAKVIPFRKVRVHRAVLLLHPCSKLWYFSRALDKQAEGKIILIPQQLQLLNESKSTIYRWLREGRELGLFRRYSWQGNTLKLILGGLKKACKRSQITKWGTAADEVPLSELLQPNGRRMIASAITTQDLQERSRYAARKQLNKLERRCFEIPTAEQLLNSQTSPKLDSGGIRGVVHLGNSRLFVGRSFIPFGVSQNRVCETLNSEPHSCGVSRWTLRRHLDKLGVKSRQVVQARREYHEITNVINLGGTSWTCKSDADISFRWTNEPDKIILNEPNGNSSARREGGHRLKLDRLFRYFGTSWMYRCNLYSLNYKLTSMKVTRWQWKREQLRAPQVAVENSLIETRSPLDPPLNETPEASGLRRASGGQNKGCKNDNSQNVELESTSANTDEIPAVWYETKARLLQKQQERKQAKIKSLESLSTNPMKDYWDKIFGR